VIAESGPFPGALAAVRRAATSAGPVVGATHNFYRYPARFSPGFARTAIESFSKPGDLVLDPFMGGGTAVVESMLANRRAVGNDLNSLAVFLARIKTTALTKRDHIALTEWITHTIPGHLFNCPLGDRSLAPCPRRTRNLGIPRARAIKKVMHLALESLSMLPSARARDFARGILLNSGQWALNGRRLPVSARRFRDNIGVSGRRMLDAIKEFGESLPANCVPPLLVNGDAGRLGNALPFANGTRADVVVTSPPYPGIHVLYHRWQVDGRKETPAAYWLANRHDGNGSAYYNLGDRRESDLDSYFTGLERTFRGIRSVVKDGGYLVQLVAFAKPGTQLPRFLRSLSNAGFSELRLDDLGLASTHRRIWRDVPGRKWHAIAKGKTSSSREVVMVHRAS